MYDLIGDIHGHADELVQLLEALGYKKGQGVYRHPERKVIFLGDFIDRGPKLRQVLEIVRPMIEEGKVLAVMGNHELNALAYHTVDPEESGQYPATSKPVFVGHYWLSAHRPTLLTDNVACLDFSVAKGGFLCAYRWECEQKLKNENFVWVAGRSGD